MVGMMSGRVEVVERLRYRVTSWLSSEPQIVGFWRETKDKFNKDTNKYETSV